jgi:hypothetical protein
MYLYVNIIVPTHHHITSGMNMMVKTALVLVPAIASALHLPSTIISSNEISRRSVVSTLIASSTAAVAYSSTAANASGESIGKVTLNSKNKKAFPLASFGLQVYDDDTAYRLTLTALEVGYRNFFASVLAGNQRGFAKVNSR